MLNKDGFNPQTGEWNDSSLGDFLWDNTNIGEALPNVLTPFTWSIMSYAYGLINVVPGYHIVGNICGRPYQNGTVMYALLQAIGKNPDEMIAEIGGGVNILDKITIPMISLSRKEKLSVIANGIKAKTRERLALIHVPRFIDQNPQWCQDMHQRIADIKNPAEIQPLWDELANHTRNAFWRVVSTAWQNTEIIAALRQELLTLSSAEDTNALLSACRPGSDVLASVAPVASLSKVASGELSREEYLQRHGHRGPNEAEFSAPRPAEDPTWIDQQLEALKDSKIEVDEMLATQQAKFRAAWDRLVRNHPKEIKSLERKLEKARQIHHLREAVRSESTRAIWVTRTLALRAGEMSGVGDDIFFLTFDEMLALMKGDDEPVDHIPARIETYQRYCSLPPLPRMISGQFDAFTWAKLPHRRSDYFDSHKPAANQALEISHTLKGNAGSAGSYEGIVRVLGTAEEGQQLRDGEILVAHQTNVGWTLIFPRAGAVITNVGAVLSHASIVARELGIPAVVGCGDATTRLETGDRVRVDGSRGIVEILERV
jgi:rifampicin phosphotransferase